MNNALYVAAEADPSIKREEVSILGPCFFAENDLNAGAAKSDQLTWGLTTWVRGSSNVGPDSIKDFSAYDVIDSLVSYYMDTDTFPNLNVGLTKIYLTIHIDFLKGRDDSRPFSWSTDGPEVSRSSKIDQERREATLLDW